MTEWISDTFTSDVGWRLLDDLAEGMQITGDWPY